MPTISKFYNVQAQNCAHGPLALQEVGPILQVEIGIPAALAAFMDAQGAPLPAPLVGLALVDTGAKSTCVDGASFAALGVNPIGVVNVLTAAGPAQQSIYPARFRFPDGLEVEFNSVIGADLTGQVIPVAQPPAPAVAGSAGAPHAVQPQQGANLIALIGRDLLAGFTMNYHGPLGLVTLSY